MLQNSPYLKIYNTLSDEDKSKANRLFNLKRRLLDDCNIKDDPNIYKDIVSLNYDSYECNLTGLSDQDKFILVIIIYDLYDFGVTRKLYRGAFGWEPLYVTKLFKFEDCAISTYLTDDEGYLHGRGYILNNELRLAMNELYEEFLWHDSSEDIPNLKRLFEFVVDIPKIYSGKLTGLYNSGNDTYTLVKPNLNVSNWPKEGDPSLFGYSRNMLVKKDCNYIKYWRIKK